MCARELQTLVRTLAPLSFSSSQKARVAGLPSGVISAVRLSMSAYVRFLDDCHAMQESTAPGWLVHFATQPLHINRCTAAHVVMISFGTQGALM